MNPFIFLTLFVALLSFNLQAANIYHASVSAVGSTEVNEAMAIVTFKVQLDRPVVEEVANIDFNAVGVTARPGSDFAVTAETLTFLPGESSKFVDVVLIDDIVDEEAEEFFQGQIMALSENVIVTKPTEMITIIDNDEVFDIQNVTVKEPDANQQIIEMVISRKYPSKRQFIMEVSTEDISALAGEDYLPLYEQVIFAPNDLMKTIKLTVLGDNKPELEESFSLKVVGISDNLRLKNPLPLVNIQDEDGVLALRFRSSMNTGSSPGIPVGYLDTIDTGPIPLNLVQDDSEEFYRSDSVAPNHQFSMLGTTTLPSTPGEFSVKKLSGVKEIENAVLHYVIGPRKMKCQLSPYVSVWMECFFPKLHALIHKFELHPNNQQLPGENILTTGFKKVKDVNEEGVVIGRKSFSGEFEVNHPFANDVTEEIIIEIMLIPDEV